MNPAKKTSSENVTTHPELALAALVSVPERIRKFSTTRYCGSKRQLLGWIYENIQSLKFDTVLDGFGGTGSVSLLFKAMGKEVTYNDAFLFNRHVAETVLSDELSLSRDLFSNFVNQTVPEKGLIYKSFKKLYYLDAENCWLDGFAKKVFSSDLTNKQRSLYLYALFQACLKKRPFNLFHRYNLNLRLNQKVKRTFGNFRTWEQPFSEFMVQSYDEVAASVWKGRRNVKILNSSNVSKIKAGYDLVYLDPPYVSLIERYNRDDYWRKYHCLEGLSYYPEWHKRIVKESCLKALRVPNTFLDWNRKATFERQLYKLIKKHKQSIVVLSYVSDSYPDESKIESVFEKSFSQLSIHSREHTHALSRSKKRELLFIGRP